MKKIISIIFVSVFFLLSGCSFLEEANDSINYATEATEYINELSTFAEDTSSLVQEAANNPEAKAELESKLTSLEDTITEFNNVEVPGIADDIHQNLEEKNQQLLDITNNVMENGEVAVEKLQESEIYQTIENITGLMNQIEELGL
ncbi:hypothetical protein CIL05_09975 [Virgibacillus profundi]|uniref:Lipoprotein n=1 Tax=Virgibacillus profundi TaxID=2024555 RepID=A0A2A2ICF4_9BACI|nr:DUF6376 family protein [Virgibacillus profundi]PAV29691.1 hypothetical protein CIL05_09975 [Virgibacillus profundi]PXY53863.1 hypothetical protein CIT14_10070 [Virgibacillus profundi]